MAEAMIVRYEQKEIAPPIYREFKTQYELMQIWAPGWNFSVLVNWIPNLFCRWYTVSSRLEVLGKMLR